VLSPGGEALPLEDEVRSLVDAGARGLIQITGPSGSGKTTTLRHLAAVLPEACALYLDDSGVGTLGNPAGNLLISARREATGRSYLATYQMAPWGEDEWIEYLLTVHRERCGSVVKRLRVAADRDLLPPLPELWRVVLDEMAADESVNGVRQALRCFVARQVASPEVEQAIRLGCLRLLLPAGSIPHRPEDMQPACPQALWRLLRHEAIRLLLAAEQIVADLRERLECSYLYHHLPRALVRETAARAATVPEAVEYLHKLAAGPAAGVPAQLQPMAASILHATDTGWVPSGEHMNLYGAYLQQAAWPYVRMPDANLEHADLSGAYLHEAVLDRAAALHIDLTQARLPGASLKAFRAAGANLVGADLSLVKASKAVFNRAAFTGANLESAVLTGAVLTEADLTGACLVDADLSGACLEGAEITDADFTAANLELASLRGLCLRKGTFTGARFAGANLTGCDLEYLQLPAADFRIADLTGAYLTASWMPEANFENACLRGAGLADVNWAGACLRGADLTGASFHAGSSRSGLIFSPIACEGSRTGFYTDDSDEQYFKCPEEVRKANLCGADLRGAVLTDVDFYLVDLRGALFDPEQEQHLRRCRAILEARV
jgi:uncharacterized protein YjbI with pentapeptide repeats/energy-coupling factor transporter ATP-binding protein EcfA2